MLEGKKIVLGITGSIAAYKSCLLARLLIKEGVEVQAVMTPAAKEFITPLSISTLTRRPAVSEFFDRRDGSWHSHVDLGLWADAMVIAPATASTISKMANGIADNMLTTTYLSMKAPVFVAPAMDLDMYAHPSTQHNIDTLRSYGNYVIEPATGFLASKLEGKGRMEEPENIVRALRERLSQNHDLKDKRVMITAGPTYEKIDPVRFIGNYSSGKMGFALAEECAARGARVTLITGPVSVRTAHSNIERTDVESAEEMYTEAVKSFRDADIAVLCAAVADFTVPEAAHTKIKRDGNTLTLTLHPTRDIAHDLGAMKKPGQILAGFALETDNEETNAQEKMKRKNLDFIVLNSLRDEGACFRHDTNKVSIIDSLGKTSFPLKDKKEVAKDIIDYVVKTRRI